MTAKDIDEAVAKATGEDVRTIAWLGFVMLEPEPAAPVKAPSHSVGEIDWDDLALERYLAMCG